MATASSPISERPAPQPQEKQESFFPTPNQFFALLAAYIAVQIITRSLVTEAAGIDEADQLVRGQQWSWGYGPQAPLYTWLMTFFLRTFGSSVFSLALLRELMLFGIYALTYLNARWFAHSHLCGLAAALALQFHPTIVWESQRELTHSIAASLMVLAMLLAFQRLRKEQLWPWVAFGICAGLATLSKYNAALVCGALLISALSLPSLRQRVLDWRMILALVVSILIVLPNALWAAQHTAEASGSMYKLGIHETMSWPSAVKTGLWVWFETALLHVLPLVALFAVLFCPAFFRAAWRTANDDAKCLCRVFLILNVVIVLSILIFKVTAFKDRWLQPLFIWLPILLVLLVKDSLAGRRLNILLGVGAAITVAMAAVIPGRLFFTEARGRRDVLNAPFRRLAADLAEPLRNADCVIVDGYWLAGNLNLRFPEKRIYSVDLNPPTTNVANCVLVWDATRRTNAPEALLHFANRQENGKGLSAPLFLEEKWKYHKSKTMRLGVLKVGP